MTFKKLAAALLFAACSLPALAQETLVAYWTKGFYPQEDKALDDMIDKFQKKTGVKVELSRYAPQESVPKVVAALDSGTPPDVAYGDVFDFQVAGKWAFEGRLEDLSDILVPMKANFLPITLETTFMWNDKTKKRAYYAFPMKRQTMHIQYWKDMLA
ncbi:MAG: extracellular solute-binding protein, partial [Betaproteobacteria bacterium]